MSQGTLSQHFNIATPPQSAGRALATQVIVNPLQDPLAEADPWAGSTIGRISTPGVACFGASAAPCVVTPGVASIGPQSGTPAVSGGHSDETGARFKATPAKLP
eukprot:4727142-Amphidinium_carterae.2